MHAYAPTPSKTLVCRSDIALRSSDVERDTTRADFLTRSDLSGTRGYRALEQKRLPTVSLLQRAPWHTSISPFLRRYVPDAPDDVGLPDTAKYDLKEDNHRTGDSLRREHTAAQQLALDLALSSHVYAPHAFMSAKPSDSDSALTHSRLDMALPARNCLGFAG